VNTKPFPSFHLVIGLLCIAAITFIFSRVLPANATTVGFLYLIVVLGVATLAGFAEAAVASVVAMLCYNFFFLPPVGRFTIADPQNWIALFTFLLTAIVASHLSDRAKKQTLEAKRRQKETEQLYALSRSILLTDAAQPVGPQAAMSIAQIFESPAVIIYDAKSSAVFAGGPGDLDGINPPFEQVVLQGSPHRDASLDLDVWPIVLGGHAIGALAARGIHVSDGVVQALLNIVAIALERVRTEEAANRAEIARQSEEFKSTLLDAIAHEFKTPLTSIKAASTSLLAGPRLLPSEQNELLSIIDEETDRLSLLVTEAVRMSEIDAGKVTLQRSGKAVAALVADSIASFGGRGDDRITTMGDLDSVPLVFVDPEMIVLALRQLIDNALKYSPPDRPVVVRAEADAGRVILKVIDQGPGIPERDRERIFQKFYRRANVRDKLPGSGLGLHIAREIVRTHGGDLWADAAEPAGAQFCMSLPVSQEQPA